jgi:uncharacterized protein (TIGR02246 family)
MRVEWVFVAAISMLAGCSPGNSQPDRSSDERVIRELEARWLKAAKDRNAAAQAVMYAPDGIAYRNGEEPLVGPAAIERWEANEAAKNPKAVVTYKTEHLYVGASGDVAVETGIGTISHLGPIGEDLTIHRSAMVTVWKKVNGEWKVWRDIGSDVP